MESTNIKSSSKFSNGINFEMAINSEQSKSFDIISNRLYVQKEKSIIRELISNGIDASKEANVNDAIIVKFPTFSNLNNRLDNEFYIQDFGIGMSHETFENVYCSYFRTTKENKPNLIGCYGVGGKTPFIYTDSYKIETTSPIDNIRRTYIVSLYNKVPSFIHVEMEDVINSNIKGTRISFPLKKIEDIYDFYYSLKFFSYSNYPIKTNVKNLSKNNFDIENDCFYDLKSTMVTNERNNLNIVDINESVSKIFFEVELYGDEEYQNNIINEHLHVLGILEWKYILKDNFVPVNIFINDYLYGYDIPITRNESKLIEEYLSLKFFNDNIINKKVYNSIITNSNIKSYTNDIYLNSCCVIIEFFRDEISLNLSKENIDLTKKNEKVIKTKLFNKISLELELIKKSIYENKLDNLDDDFLLKSYSLIYYKHVFRMNNILNDYLNEVIKNLFNSFFSENKIYSHNFQHYEKGFNEINKSSDFYNLLDNYISNNIFLKNGTFCHSLFIMSLLDIFSIYCTKDNNKFLNNFNFCFELIDLFKRNRIEKGLYNYKSKVQHNYKDKLALFIEINNKDSVNIEPTYYSNSFENMINEYQYISKINESVFIKKSHNIKDLYLLGNRHRNIFIEGIDSLDFTFPQSILIENNSHRNSFFIFFFEDLISYSRMGLINKVVVDLNKSLSLKSNYFNNPIHVLNLNIHIKNNDKFYSENKDYNENNLINDLNCLLDLVIGEVFKFFYSNFSMLNEFKECSNFSSYFTHPFYSNKINGIKDNYLSDNEKWLKVKNHTDDYLKNFINKIGYDENYYESLKSIKDTLVFKQENIGNIKVLFESFIILKELIKRNNFTPTNDDVTEIYNYYDLNNPLYLMNFIYINYLDVVFEYHLSDDYPLVVKEELFNSKFLNYVLYK